MATRRRVMLLVLLLAAAAATLFAGVVLGLPTPTASLDLCRAGTTYVGTRERKLYWVKSESRRCHPSGGSGPRRPGHGVAATRAGGSGPRRGAQPLPGGQSGSTTRAEQTSPVRRFRARAV